MMNNIYLIGFMGTGKTCVAKALARSKQWACVDLDALIEERQGMTIAEIFTRKGEPFFRALEKTLLKEAAGGSGCVVACGGGIVLDQKNMALMKQTGRMVCLTARPEVILKRTSGYAHRPLLNVKDPAQKIRELLQQRAAYYAQADLTVDTSDLSIEQVVDAIMRDELAA